MMMLQCHHLDSGGIFLHFSIIKCRRKIVLPRKVLCCQMALLLHLHCVTGKLVLSLSNLLYLCAGKGGALTLFFELLLSHSNLVLDGADVDVHRGQGEVVWSGASYVGMVLRCDKCENHWYDGNHIKDLTYK